MKISFSFLCTFCYPWQLEMEMKMDRVRNLNKTCVIGNMNDGCVLNG